MSYNSRLVTRTQIQRRTGLTARTGLRTKSAPARRTRLQRAGSAGKTVRAQQRKDRDPGEFADAVKLACRTRAGKGDPDEALCESCGYWLGRHGGVIQHRRARKAGGCRLRLINGIVNAALQCGTPLTGCNGLAEARDRDMNGIGFWLEWNEAPDLTPVMLHGVNGDGIKVWLTWAGGYSEFAPAEGGDG